MDNYDDLLGVSRVAGAGLSSDLGIAVSTYLDTDIDLARLLTTAREVTYALSGIRGLAFYYVSSYSLPEV